MPATMPVTSAKVTVVLVARAPTAETRVGRVSTPLKAASVRLLPRVSELRTAGTAAPLTRAKPRSPTRPPSVIAVCVPKETRPVSPLPSTRLEFCSASALSRVSVPPVMRVEP